MTTRLSLKPGGFSPDDGVFEDPKQFWWKGPHPTHGAAVEVCKAMISPTAVEGHAFVIGEGDDLSPGFYFRLTTRAERNRFERAN